MQIDCTIEQYLCNRYREFLTLNSFRHERIEVPTLRTDVPS